MAGNDELKKIAELSFGTDQVGKDLAKVEQQLNKWIGDLKNKQFKEIQTGFSNCFKVTGDVSGIDKSYAKHLMKIKEQENELNIAKEKSYLKDQNNFHKMLYAKELDNQKTQNNIAEYTEKMATKQQTMWDRIGNMANTYLTYQGFNTLKRTAQEVIDEMVNVESQMVQIDRVLNEDSLNIDNYRDKLIGLAHDYGNSFENVADITLRLAQAGFDSQQSLALTEKTLLALNTAELNATQATDDMIAVMSQWNLMTGSATEVADDYAMIIDKVNRVADNFPTTSADIMDALKKTSSAFNMAGASIDETIASIVAAEKASQRGGKAIGTALNSIVQQLKTEGRLATMESLGINLYTDETKTEFKSIMEIFEQLSNKMEQLKREGKESSVEMQNLLSVFTVLRRNIGGSFLGEMAGDDSTYNKVLELVQAYDTIGYSIQENEKYMRTAKAAQEQFNATLLQLKTSIWENGAEDVFRSLLLLGTDIVKVFKVLIDTFGTFPTTIGMVTLAFSLFNKELQAVKINEQGSAIELSGFLAKLSGAKAQLAGTTAALEGTTTASLGLKAATIALNAAYSLGLSLAITAVIALYTKLVHAEEEARKKQQEIIDQSREEISKNEQEAATLERLIEDYEKYANMQMPEDTQEREELIKNIEAGEKAISEYLIQSNAYTSEMVGNYELQLKTIKEINAELAEKRIQENKKILDAAKENQRGLIGEDIKGAGLNQLELTRAGIDLGEYLSGFKDLKYQSDEFIQSMEGLESASGSAYVRLEDFSKLDYDTQLEALTKWKEQLDTTGKGETEAAKSIERALKILEGQTNDVTDATKELNNEIVNQTFGEWLDNHDIQNAEDYKSALEDISQITPISPEYVGTFEDFRAIMQQMAENTFPQYNEQFEEVERHYADFNGAISEEISKLETLSNAYTTLDSAIKEYNSSGEISVATFKSLIDNDLLDYLEVVNGKLQVNQASLLNAANEAKQKAIADMQAEAAAEILSIAQADLNKSMEEEAGAAQTSINSSNQAGNAALEAAKKYLTGAASIREFNAALNDSGYSGTLSKQAQKDIDAVYEKVKKRTAAINAISLSAAKTSGGASRSATKSFEDQSQERVKIFKQEISDLESLEKEWVNKYKKLEIFGTSDLKFITHQRINRYNEYLNQINQLTGISEKDRNELIREYTAERQKLELEYFDLLKQQLEDQIKELQNANKEKIQLIKDEAQARIDALKQVEDENDRIRQKEEYEAKRQELLHGYQGVEYWRQRTGREAQLALAEAEKKLAELDQDWEDKKKDWTLEEQIEEIEKARDAQIAAIEEAQEQQIAGWKAAYKAQVDLYAQTGQIIYDNSVINAGYLYEAYMNNFVSPLHTKLQEVMNTINATNAATEASAARAREVAAGGISSGTTAQSNAASSSAAAGALTAAMAAARTISAKTAAQKILDTTSSVINSLNSKNLLNSLKKVTGKFHGGGKVGTNAPEALAVLRPKEVVLTPEWAAGMDKLVQQVNEGKLLNQTSSTTTQIDVNGNLVNIDADIKNKQDVDYLTKQITKVLQDKFNIKK